MPPGAIALVALPKGWGWLLSVNLVQLLRIGDLQ